MGITEVICQSAVKLHPVYSQEQEANVGAFGFD